MSQVKSDLKAALSRISQLEKESRDFMMAAARHKGDSIEMKTLANEALILMGMLLDCTELKSAPGIYFLMNKAKKVIYIGQSENVMKRMAGHADKEFFTAKMIYHPREKERCVLEQRFIHLLNPSINKQFLGERIMQNFLNKELEKI